MTSNEQRTASNGALWPAVTCLCPTYGRFERLRDAVACFLLQDYPGQKRLLVLNDAPVPVEVGAIAPSVVLINASERYATLGHKRQALLEAARTPLVAHWDDDDLYLPWHLSMIVRDLLNHPWAGCAKPDAAWFGKGPREALRIAGVRHSVFEGQMAFDRDRALELGGYPPLDTGQAAALLSAFRRAGELYVCKPPSQELGYVYRWADGLGHISGLGRDQNSRDKHGRCNHDFGNGSPLIEGHNALAWACRRLEAQFADIVDGALTTFPPPALERFASRLLRPWRQNRRGPAGVRRTNPPRHS